MNIAVYMITYDLNSPGQKYEKLIEIIKECSTGIWCTYWKSSYLIKSNLSAQSIADKLKSALDNNDRLIVIEVTKNYSGWLLHADLEYIKKMF